MGTHGTWEGGKVPKSVALDVALKLPCLQIGLLGTEGKEFSASIPVKLQTRLLAHTSVQALEYLGEI